MARTILKSTLVTSLALCLLPLASMAHHGAGAHFDLSAEIQIEGILTDFQLVNPHAYVYFDVPNAEGGLDAWRCEMGTNLQRRASKETLLPGGRVRVTGNPARREQNLCKIELIEHEDGRTIAFNGAASDGATDYTPSGALMAVAGIRSSDTASAAERDVIAVTQSEAANRMIVEVSTEGLFGYWRATGSGFVGVAGVGRNSSASQIDSDLPQPTRFQQPAYTSVGMALLESFDERFDFPALRCESSIFDGVFHHGNNNEFVQVSDEVIRWVYGYMDVVRTIHMDQASHPGSLEPALTGHSIGRWEGDSLVVETRGFKRQWLYQISGRDRLHDGQVISSEQLSVRERISHDPENDQLVVEYWAEDPVYWEEPLIGVYRLSRSEMPYQAYNCIELGGENNRRDDGTTLFD